MKYFIKSYLCAVAIIMLGEILYFQFFKPVQPVQVWNQNEIPIHLDEPIILKHKAIIIDDRGAVTT